jgi:hypothetical protein
MDAKKAALASSVAIIVGAVASTMLARRLRRTETPEVGAGRSRGNCPPTLCSTRATAATPARTAT